MEAKRALVDDASLSVPAVEVIDLSSDSSDGGVEDTGERTAGAGKGTGPMGEPAEHEDGGDSDDQWESESLYADALEGMGDEHLLEGERDACTLDEAVAYRKQLRAVGEDRFVAETVQRGAVSAKKLCTAFGIRPPPFLEGAPDQAYYPLLGLGMARELSKRVKLPQHNTVDDAVRLLQESRNIIVLTGAGISTSLGIPDFRSKETGLYSKLEHLGLSDPQEVFDIEVFREDPSIFYSIAKDLLPSTDRFSPTHAFIRVLQENGKLLTNFSQNIDNLEAKAGIRADKLVQCHGSFATATCVKCRHRVQGEDIYPDLKAGRVARCPRCLQELLETRPAGLKRKRSGKHAKKGQGESDSSDEGDYDVPEAGVMKPDITFFGEDLPTRFHDRLVDHDRAKVDLVVVIGTSLKVAPVSEVVGFLPPDVPQIYISRTPVSHINFDVDLLGDCDVVVAELCRRAGWTLEHDMVPAGEEVEVELQAGHKSRYLLKRVGGS
ncbi:MAG: NAD-dependent histone deacetylase sir2 [Thelocarpon impressellum]|nr:MAG: NAD-dependent histone deacetylase sir2 [Thelocarpon impressellum]